MLNWPWLKVVSWAGAEVTLNAWTKINIDVHGCTNVKMYINYKPTASRRVKPPKLPLDSPTSDQNIVSSWLYFAITELVISVCYQRTHLSGVRSAKTQLFCIFNTTIIILSHRSSRLQRSNGHTVGDNSCISLTQAVTEEPLFKKTVKKLRPIRLNWLRPNNLRLNWCTDALIYSAAELQECLNTHRRI